MPATASEAQRVNSSTATGANLGHPDRHNRAGDTQAVQRLPVPRLAAAAVQAGRACADQCGGNQLLLEVATRWVE